MLSASQTTVMNNLVVIHLSQSGLRFTHLWLYKAYTELFRWLWWVRQSPPPSPKPHAPLAICVVTLWSRPGYWPGWKMSRGKKHHSLFLLKWPYKQLCWENWRNTIRAASWLEAACRQPLLYVFPFCHLFFWIQLKSLSRLHHPAWIPVIFSSSPTPLFLSCLPTKSSPLRWSPSFPL